jgi:alpha-1,2-mannosyltransferase
VGNITAIRDSELGVHPLVAPPIQNPVLDITRDWKGKTIDAGPRVNVSTPALQRPAFFLVRAVLGTICTICEAKLYDTVRLKINNRVARYMLFMLVANAGMWSASTGESLLFDTRSVHHLSCSDSDFFPALLPSSFAMYTTMLALSHAFIPPSNKDGQRTLATVMYFTIGAVLGWPFALAIAIPFVVEELFVFGADQVAVQEKLDWQRNRGVRLLLCGAVAATILVSMIPFLRLAFTERCAGTRSRN